MNAMLLVLLLLELGSVCCFPQHLVSLDTLHLQENDSTFHLLYGNTLARQISSEKPGLRDRISEYLRDLFDDADYALNCSTSHPSEAFHIWHITRFALFLTTDGAVPYRAQMYWINKSGQQVFQNRLISNGGLYQFTLNLTCPSELHTINVSLIERNNSFYLYGIMPFSRKTVQPPAYALQILTFNVWNMRSKAKSQSAYSRRLERMVSEIGRVMPDVIGLQEVRFDSRVKKGLSPNQAEHFWRRIPGYNFIFQPANFDISVGSTKKLEEGLAILSRYPITAWSYILLPGNSSLDVHQRICLHAQIATPLLPQLQVFVTHLSLNQELRQLAVADIVRFMRGFEGSKVLMGDMNAEPGSSEMQGLRGSDLEDAWLLFHSEPEVRTSEKVEGREDRFFGLTFDATELYLRKRIDYIYVHRSFLNKADSVALFGAGRSPNHSLSDHLGVLLHLVDRGGMHRPSLKEEL